MSASRSDATFRMRSAAAPNSSTVSGGYCRAESFGISDFNRQTHVLNQIEAAAQMGIVLDHMQQRKPGAEFLGQRDRLLRYVPRVLRKIGGEHDLPQLQFEGSKIAAMGLQRWQLGPSRNLGANRQHRAGSVAQNVLRHRTQQQLAQPGATVSPHHDQVDVVFVDNSRQRLPHLAVTDIVVGARSLRPAPRSGRVSAWPRCSRRRKSCSC